MTRSRPSIVVALFLGAALAACAAPATREERSRHAFIPTGSRIVLSQEVEIAPHSARAYVQNGRVQPFPAIDRFRPHCKFEMKRSLPTAQKILPDTFVVTKTIEGTYRGTHSGAIRRVGLLVADGLSYELFATTIYLDSPTQKDVQSVTCQQLDDPVYARYVTVQDIRTTLGGVATLQFADVPNKTQ